MSDGPRQLGYRSDRLVKGRLLTRQIDPAATDLPATYRPWLGPAVAVELLPQFRRFRCRACGHVDEVKCFRAGLPPDFVVPEPRPDLHVTEDDIDIWSRRLADRICEIASEHVELFELPGDPGYLVPWPGRLFTVPKRARVYKDGEIATGVAFRAYSPPCAKCGRYASTTFERRNFTVPEDVVLAAAAIDTADYPAMFRLLTWIISAPLAKALQAEKFTNVKISASFANS